MLSHLTLRTETTKDKRSGPSHKVQALPVQPHSSLWAGEEAAGQSHTLNLEKEDLLISFFIILFLILT